MIWDERLTHYLQEAISIVQIWLSSGYLLNSIMQENVNFNLELKYIIISDLIMQSTSTCRESVHGALCSEEGLVQSHTETRPPLR